MMGLLGRKESQTSKLVKINLREWETDRLWKVRSLKADYYDEVKELRDTPERWNNGETYERHDDRLKAILHSLDLIEKELRRRGEMRGGGVGTYLPNV